MDFDNIYSDLKIIYHYMNLNHIVKKCDLIIGCGCTNLKIPKICSDLKKRGYANKIIFSGGQGKVTSGKFSKSEAEIFRDIAISEGISEKNIYLDTNSQNTADNFRNCKKLIEEQGWDIHSILIVHNTNCERRTYNTCKAIMGNLDITITSESLPFYQYFERLKKKEKEEISIIISVVVANIQRMIVYPQFGLQIEEEVPKDVIDAYYHLKSLGFGRYLLKKSDIDKLANQYGTKGKEILYFE